ncbi:MAG: hypothetical protein ABEJ88_09355 [Halobacterium sp.]
MEWYSVDESIGTEDEFYWLWILATATYGVGDVVTTVALVYYAPGVREGNPVVSAALASLGLGGLVTVKLAVFFGCLALSLWSMHAWKDRVLYVFPPLVLSVVGVVLTVLNLGLLSSL